MAPVFKQLHIVEKVSDHVFSLVQIRLDLRRVLDGFSRAQRTHILHGEELFMLFDYAYQVSLIQIQSVRVSHRL